MESKGMLNHLENPVGFEGPVGVWSRVPEREFSS